jgi:hypothetical protein
MLIHFNDGSKKLLEFSAPVADNDANLAVRLKEALDASHLIVEADGALIVIRSGASSTSSASRRRKSCPPTPSRAQALRTDQQIRSGDRPACEGASRCVQPNHAMWPKD